MSKVAPFQTRRAMLVRITTTAPKGNVGVALLAAASKS